MCGVARLRRAGAGLVAAGGIDGDRQRELGFLHDVLDQFFTADIGEFAGEQALFGQHDDAVQRGPDLQRGALAESGNRGRDVRAQRGARVSHGE